MKKLSLLLCLSLFSCSTTKESAESQAPEHQGGNGRPHYQAEAQYDGDYDAEYDPRYDSAPGYQRQPRYGDEYGARPPRRHAQRPPPPPPPQDCESTASKAMKAVGKAGAQMVVGAAATAVLGPAGGAMALAAGSGATSGGASPSC